MNALGFKENIVIVEARTLLFATFAALENRTATFSLVAKIVGSNHGIFNERFVFLLWKASKKGSLDKIKVIIISFDKK